MQRPDDVMRLGPISIARFGNKIIYKKDVTSEQQQTITQKFSESLEKTKTDIDSQVAALLVLIRRNSPLALLRHSYGRFAAAAIGRKSEPEWTSDEDSTVWTLEYIFSVIASTPLDSFGNVELTDEDYNSISQGVRKLINSVGMNYAIASTSRRKIDGTIQDGEYEELFTKCMMHWSAVRKSRYSSHDIPYLSYFLAPHDDVFRELFSISVSDFVTAIENIAHALSRGMIEACEAMASIHKEFFEILGDRTFSSPEEMRQLMSEFGLTERMDHVLR